MTDPQTITAHLFRVFALVLESQLQGGEMIRRGILTGGMPWSITGMALAQERLEHGARRHFGLPHTDEPAALALLRGIAQDLIDTPDAFEAIVARQAALHFPSAATRPVAIGLEDADTEYSGNLILIDLRDLARATLRPDGSLAVRTDGRHDQVLRFTFRGKTLGELAAGQAHVVPAAPGRKPKLP